jgi:hypothetical protein
VSNHAELYIALRDRIWATQFTFSNIVLDRSGLYYQYHLFRNAKVVIAQHGAALANIFFMRSPRDHASTANGAGGSAVDRGTLRSKGGKSIAPPAAPAKDDPVACVIEICTPYGRKELIFRNLASLWNVGYDAVNQAREMGNVDVTAVVAAFNRTLVKCLSVSS